MKNVILMNPEEFKEFESKYYAILGKVKMFGLSDEEIDVLSEGFRSCLAVKAYISPGQVLDSKESVVKKKEVKDDSGSTGGSGFITSKIYVKNPAELMALRTKLDALGYKKEGTVAATANTGKSGGFVVTNENGKYTFSSDTAKFSGMQIRSISAEKVIKTGKME